jgi:hypothetical protein
MPSTFQDLAEHTGTLITLLGGLATICIALIVVIYRKLNAGVEEIKNELSKEVGAVRAGLSKHLEDSSECQKNLPKLYMNKLDADRQFAALFGRQNDLREKTLPQDYVRRTELEQLNKSLVQLIDRGFNDLGTRVDKLSDRLDANLEMKRENWTIK